MSPEFFLTSFIVVLAPGAGVLFTVATGVTRGARHSVIAAFGCTLGIVPHMAAAILGLAALLQASALAFEIFRFAGIAYLLYVAWQMLRQKGPLSVGDAPHHRSARQTITMAILINLLNPKLSIYFLAFLPQFVSPDSPDPVPHMLALSAAFMLMTFAVFVVYGALASLVRDHVLSRPAVLRWIRWTFAGAFVALGFRLALQTR